MKLTGLGVWNLYFLLKFVLFIRGDISFHFLENLALFSFLALSFSKPLVQRSKHVIAVVAAVVLLYYDSWLPPISRLTKQAANVQDFSIGYFLEISSRVVNVDLLLGIFVAAIFYWYTAKWLRYTSFSLLGFGYVYWLSTSVQLPLESAPVVRNSRESAVTNTQVDVVNTQQTPDQQLQRFYQQQSLLTSNFPAAITGESFDVLILNVCSIANADLEAIGVDVNELFADFDILFSDFNSATSYSGPAAIRLLRASCGQTSQQQLFKPAAQQCHLFSNLEKLGYNTQVAMNHDGHFDDFKGLISTYGGIKVPTLDFTNYSPAQYGFDDKPIYSDQDVLANWLKSQPQSNTPRALYYNTISLHDGNQVAGQRRMSSIESYPRRQQQLFSDIGQFIAQLEKQGRNTLLMVVPEHGAALTGDKVQFSGLREIPSPRIVSVPTAVKFIGANVKHSGLIEVSDPTSYFALSELVSRALRNDVFSGAGSIRALLENLPVAPKVAENQDTIMMYINKRPYIQLDGGEWTAYPQN
ncbi:MULTISPECIES: cellulose biosynthesis protein BcsG [Pseudoalteromonas]|uniref:cellulose biosynthesis protein BcsG n=1 Tax=Pseudoalteromonas TaxID=53246 RepID=UPI0002DFADFE|nr:MULTISPECIES: cellulose biosynthesis protein BcsG [Pseudoalteromonas]MCF6143642.1 hypothetical protein [Pseudoalteromonas mariniglutinosa NCIMB 1770]